MQSINLTNLRRFEKDLKLLVDELPEKRRKLYEWIAEYTKDEVNSQSSNSSTISSIESKVLDEIEDFVKEITQRLEG
jgi:hypothetical protein